MSAAVLVVEDEQPLTRFLNTALTKAGYAVTLACNGVDGLQKALASHPDIILLDIMMPGVDGIAMLKKLRQDAWGADAKVIVLSNLSDPEHMLSAVSNGALDYLIKADVSLERLLAQIGDRLKRSAAGHGQ